jgi:hypothetical protein
MKPITEHNILAARNQRFACWTGRILLITGILALSYVALTLIGAKIYQRYAALTLDKQIHTEEQRKFALPAPI